MRIVPVDGYQRRRFADAQPQTNDPHERGRRSCRCHRSCAGVQSMRPDHIDGVDGEPRVVVLSDVGNEPDDQMSLVRLLLYSNEFGLEALVATTSSGRGTRSSRKPCARWWQSTARCGPTC